MERRKKRRRKRGKDIETGQRGGGNDGSLKYLVLKCIIFLASSCHYRQPSLLVDMYLYVWLTCTNISASLEIVTQQTAFSLQMSYYLGLCEFLFFCKETPVICVSLKQFSHWGCMPKSGEALIPETTVITPTHPWNNSWSERYPFFEFSKRGGNVFLQLWSLEGHNKDRLICHPLTSSFLSSCRHSLVATRIYSWRYLDQRSKSFCVAQLLSVPKQVYKSWDSLFYSDLARLGCLLCKVKATSPYVYKFKTASFNIIPHSALFFQMHVPFSNYLFINHSFNL
jgi:hypothetical protein